MTTAKIFRDSLAALISEMKKDGRGERRIPLREGVRSESGVVGTIYSFAWSDPADLLFEGARVAFQRGVDKLDAIVALVTPERIVLQLPRDLGGRIDTATIVVDQTAFLDALRRRMEDIAMGRAIAFDVTHAEPSRHGKDLDVDCARRGTAGARRTGARPVQHQQGSRSGVARVMPTHFRWAFAA